MRSMMLNSQFNILFGTWLGETFRRLMNNVIRWLFWSSTRLYQIIFYEMAPVVQSDEVSTISKAKFYFVCVINKQTKLSNRIVYSESKQKFINLYRVLNSSTLSVIVWHHKRQKQFSSFYRYLKRVKWGNEAILRVWWWNILRKFIKSISTTDTDLMAYIQFATVRLLQPVDSFVHILSIYSMFPT